jgi:hypothetical protein
MDLGDYTADITGALTYLTSDGSKTLSMSTDTDDDVITSEENVTNFAVNTTVGYDAYSAYVQYAGTYSKDAFAAGDKSYNSALNTWVEYDGFANTTIQLEINCLSLNDEPADHMVYGATVDYTMGAITYEMAPTYYTASGDDTFEIFWNVQMDF